MPCIIISINSGQGSFPAPEPFTPGPSRLQTQRSWDYGLPRSSFATRRR